MRLVALLLALSIGISGCGGGGAAGTPLVGATVLAAKAEEASARQAAADAAALAAAKLAAATYCGIDVGPSRIEGVVTSVHDGDTVTVDSPASGVVKVRLEGIDAPELSQLYGPEARAALSEAVLNRAVNVTFDKQDQYGRYVGAVFTSDCGYTNLNLVRIGLAWFYKAYQCEMSAAIRAQFAQAQDEASQASKGLWVQDEPEAPWFYRNGKEPATPTCTSATAAWTGSLALTSNTTAITTNTTIPATTTGNSTEPAPICYVGSRGGTYTITASGKKNYGRC